MRFRDWLSPLDHSLGFLGSPIQSTPTIAPRFSAGSYALSLAKSVQNSCMIIKREVSRKSTALLYTLAMLFVMNEKRSERLLAELKSWADAAYGRRAELARMLGVSKQLISEWFAGRSVPTWDHGLEIEAFLKKQRRRR